MLSFFAYKLALWSSLRSKSWQWSSFIIKCLSQKPLEFIHLQDFHIHRSNIDLISQSHVSSYTTLFLIFVFLISVFYILVLLHIISTPISKKRKKKRNNNNLTATTKNKTPTKQGTNKENKKMHTKTTSGSIMAGVGIKNYPDCQVPLWYGIFIVHLLALSSCLSSPQWLSPPPTMITIVFVVFFFSSVLSISVTLVGIGNHHLYPVVLMVILFIIIVTSQPFIIFCCPLHHCHHCDHRCRRHFHPPPPILLSVIRAYMNQI